MTHDIHPSPIRYQGVMVSSTFEDLSEHRSALIKAIKGQGLTDVVMENDSAKVGIDLIDSSLQMVRDSAAYVGIISHKYGQIPKCPKRNPRNLSITELEFDEAQRLNRPTLLFIMGDKHQVIPGNVETNASRRKKLSGFRDRAKKIKRDSHVHRIYATFENLEEFKSQAIHAVANLRRYLDEQPAAVQDHPVIVVEAEPNTIPAPPDFYAEPPYIGSHEFLGRRAELERLSDWASPSDSHPIILFEAIGGAGKSLLTWEWTAKHATQIRGDWAGRFWYSFYEKGAIMADFCRHALSYITGQPLHHFRKRKTVQLGEMLLGLLQKQPWLLVLDGLERVLVAYHRFDAAQLVDEEAGRTDEIAHRDPCAAIRPEDDDLLRALAGALPSKLILTSRLVPRVLLNSSSQLIPGVVRVPLPGLRPPDAEALLRACGISGNSQDIQHYLKNHCDCHPLVAGVLAGLINDYLPDRGNFDAWAEDAAYGGQLNLAALDLIQKRNHILNAALTALSEKSRQLLSTLALISESVDYQTLSALNPHLPTVESSEFLAAQQELTKTVRDLERRGLLQYDAQTKRHDLHPVVRGIAAGKLRPEERENYGQRVVDYFSSQSHNPYEQAETIEDLRNALHVVRTLLQMGRYEQAFDAYTSDLSLALDINLQAYAEELSILRLFFPRGWSSRPGQISEIAANDLITLAAGSLRRIGESEEALSLYGISLLSRLQRKSWRFVRQCLSSLSIAFASLNRLAKRERCDTLGLDIATLINSQSDIFDARLRRFNHLVFTGQWKQAETVWQLLDPMGRDWPRKIYVPGDAEDSYNWFSFCTGTLTETQLTLTEKLARSARNRAVLQEVYHVRGRWRMECSDWELAAESFHEAVRMDHEVGQRAATSEVYLALAKLHLNQLSNPRQQAQQLAAAKNLDHQALADLWFAIGDLGEAKKHAIEAYKYAWADGEPYVRRYELNKSRALLEQLSVPIPDVPPYDPAKDEKLPWEDELVAAVEKLRAEKSAENS
jgi:tetratricopeptide (TPR) repeat protein